MQQALSNRARNCRRLFALGYACLAALVLAAGCGPRRSPVPPAGPPVVPISKPASRQVTDFVDFTGRTNPVESVNVVARVTGYLLKAKKSEGAEVKEGDTLFELD